MKRGKLSVEETANKVNVQLPTAYKDIEGFEFLGRDNCPKEDRENATLIAKYLWTVCPACVLDVLIEMVKEELAGTTCTTGEIQNAIGRVATKKRLWEVHLRHSKEIGYIFEVEADSIEEATKKALGREDVNILNVEESHHEEVTDWIQL